MGIQALRTRHTVLGHFASRGSSLTVNRQAVEEVLQWKVRREPRGNPGEPGDLKDKRGSSWVEVSLKTSVQKWRSLGNLLGMNSKDPKDKQRPPAPFEANTLVILVTLVASPFEV